MNRQIFALVISCLAACAPGLAQVYQAGTTYMSVQHNGTCGRMIGVDSMGFVHVVWMNGYNPAQNPRHVYYNVWDPNDEVFVYLPGGVQVNASTRAGYATVAVKPDGFAFPAFHQSMEEPYAAASIDFLPRSGAFTTTEPAHVLEGGNGVSIIWPKIALDPDGVIHMVGTENPPQDDPYCRMYYARGLPTYDDNGFGETISWQVVDLPDEEWLLLDSSLFVTADIAVSAVAGRLAVAWIKPRTVDSLRAQFDTELYVKVSEDFGSTWQDAINITNFIPADSECFAETGDWRCCSRDTLRPFRDLSLLFDSNGSLHIAFTAVAFFEWYEGSEGFSVQPTKAQIWHWNEIWGEFKLVAESWIEDSLLSENQNLPSYHAMVERPSLAEGADGTIYCSYLQYDTAAYSTAGCLNADVFVSALDTWEDWQWSVGTNVTHTNPGQVPAPSGENRNEQDPTLAMHTSIHENSEYLHLSALLDLDAGAAEMSSANPFKYHRISTSLIALWPDMPVRPFHVTVQPCGEAADDIRPELSQGISLSAFPNPFNSSTAIEFNLPIRTQAEVAVCDITGRRVATLASGVREAGHQVLTWNASRYASGIYFVTLETPKSHHVQKIMLLK